MNKHMVIPVFIPHLGCPHTCIFCNQKKIAGNYKKPSKEKLRKIVKDYLSTVKNKNDKFIELAFYGGSFTGIPKELQEELLAEARNLKNLNLIKGIRLSTRPDYIDDFVIKRLLKYGVETVELGVQSLDVNVLEKSERGHSDYEVIKAVKLLKNEGFKVGIQLMPGLPEDTREKTLNTTRRVIKLRPHFVRIYPTVVIKDTKLARLYEKGRYEPWSLEMAVDVSSDMYILFLREDINVIRIGLQATDNLCEGKDLIAGPYHPAFGELVKGRVFRKQLEYLLNKIIEPSYKEIVIFCHPSELSQVTGQKQINLKYLQNKYNISLKVKTDKDISLGTLGLINMEKNYCFFISRREFLSGYRI